MDRSRPPARGAAIASLLRAATALRAQDGGALEEAKVPALEDGMFLMQSSQIAQQKDQSPNVKAFADLEVAGQQAIVRAFGAEGAAVDAACLDAQIAGYQEARPIHESYAENGQDPMARGASMAGVTGIDSLLVMLQSVRRPLQG